MLTEETGWEKFSVCQSLSGAEPSLRGEDAKLLTHSSFHERPRALIGQGHGPNAESSDRRVICDGPWDIVSKVEDFCFVLT